MEKGYATQQASQKGERGGHRDLKKIKDRVIDLKNSTGKKVRIMFQDEAGFGRINTPKYCWCEEGYRPSVPCHHIREYVYAYGAVDPIDGDNFFLVLPYCNTNCMNLFLQMLSEAYPEDIILLCCDGAAWHKSGAMNSCRRSGCRCGWCSPVPYRWAPLQCPCSHGPGHSAHGFRFCRRPRRCGSLCPFPCRWARW